MRLAAKFTTILSEIIADPQNNLELESVITDDKSDLISKPNNSAIIVSKIDCISEFDVGLVIGIIWNYCWNYCWNCDLSISLVHF